jgi:hypothetical protein
LEIYYTAALTPDVQVTHGAQKENGQYLDTAVILGLRLQLVF